jgi:hypothetical protein
MADRQMSTARIVIGLVLLSAIFPLMLFPFAGRWDWGVGWALVAGGGLLWVWRRGRRTWIWASGVTTGVVLVILFALTFRQTRVWHDSESLWTHAIAVGHPSSAAHLSCGHLAGRGRLGNIPAVGILLGCVPHCSAHAGDHMDPAGIEHVGGFGTHIAGKHYVDTFVHH